MRRSSLVSVVVLSVALVVPLIAGTVVAVMALRASPLESSASVQPVVGTVESAQRLVSEAVPVSLVPAEAFPVTSQSDGVITQLEIETGSPLTSGTVAMSVSGTPVVAYVSESPLFRNIERGLTGEDVRVAQQFLKDLGYLTVVDGIAGFRTEQAIRSFNSDHGQGRNNSVLSFASLLWVPAGSSAPTDISVRVGTTISEGTDIYTATMGTDTVIVHTDPANVDRILRVNGVEFVLPAGDTEVTDSEHVASLKGSLGGQEMPPTGTIESVEPHAVGVISSTAIVIDAHGSTCFFAGFGGEPQVVSVTQGSFGSVDVDAALIGTPVLLNPRDVLSDPSCGS